MRGRGRRAAVVLAATAAFMPTVPAPASAHAYLVASDPVDGGRLGHAPHEIRLDFTEHVVLTGTRLELRTSNGDPVRLRRLRVVSQDEDTEAPSAIVATVPRLAPDAYRLSWETLSSDDLHRTSGLIVFGVDRDVTAGGAAAPTLRPEEAMLRGGLLLAMALAFGGLLAARVLRSAREPAGRAVPPDAWPLRLARVGACVAPAVSLALLVEQVAESGSSPGTLLLGGYGVRWALRTGGLLVLAIALVARTPGTGRGTRMLALSGVAMACLGTASLGHLGVGSSSPTRVVVSALHICAALSWAGAVACLAVTLLASWPEIGAPAMIRALRAFGLPAAACLSVAVASGVFLSSRVVVSVDAALLTPYGRTLILKVLLVGTAAVLGLYHHRRVRGPHDLDPPRASIVAESAALLAVVALTGVLASTGTATDPTYVSSRAPDSGLVSGRVEDLQVAVGLGPNRPGAAVATVEVFDTRRPAPAPVTGVDVSVGGGSPLVAQPLAEHRWTAPVELAASGPSRIGVTVHRGGLPDATGSFTWTVGGGSPAEPAVVSRAPLGGLLRAVAGALALILLLGWAVVTHRVRYARRVQRTAVSDDAIRSTSATSR